jgi:predicted RNase H-like HicB family nuclease
MMIDPRYEMIIYWSDEDEAFVVEVPELPGCAADGTTSEEALANAKVIITEWVETVRELGRPIQNRGGDLCMRERFLGAYAGGTCPGTWHRTKRR